MAKIEDGLSGTLLAGVDGPSRALRVSPQPMAALGHYAYSGKTGTLSGFAPFSELFQFRWSDATSLAAIQSIECRVLQVTDFTTAQEWLIEAVAVSSYVSNGSGGIATIPSSNNLKKNLQFPQSRIADLRISNSQALIAGNRVASNVPLCSASAWLDGPGEKLSCRHDFYGPGHAYPLVLGKDEGFILRSGPAPMMGTGSLRLFVDVTWAEIPLGEL